jgi:hypothetical protein
MRRQPNVDVREDIETGQGQELIASGKKAFEYDPRCNRSVFCAFVRTTARRVADAAFFRTLDRHQRGGKNSGGAAILTAGSTRRSDPSRLIRGERHGMEFF